MGCARSKRASLASTADLPPPTTAPPAAGINKRSSSVASPAFYDEHLTQRRTTVVVKEAAQGSVNSLPSPPPQASPSPAGTGTPGEHHAQPAVIGEPPPAMVFGDPDGDHADHSFDDRRQGEAKYYSTDAASALGGIF